MKPSIFTAPEESFVTTPEKIEEAELMFSLVKKTAFTLIASIAYIEKMELWRHLGFKSMKEAWAAKVSLPLSDYYRARDIYSACCLFDTQFENSAGAQIKQKRLIDETDKDFSDKLRKFLCLVNDVSLSHAAELSSAITTGKIDGELFVEGVPVKTPSGKEIDIKMVRESKREDLRTWFSEPSEQSTDKASHRKQSLKVDSFTAFDQHCQRFIREAEQMSERFFAAETSQTIFDMCEKQRRKLNDILRQFAIDLHNPECYNLSEEDDQPVNLKDPDFLSTKEIAETTGKSDRAVRMLCEDGKIPHAYLKSKKQNGVDQYRIHPEGLPESWKNLHYAALAQKAQVNKAEQELQRKKEREKILANLTPEGRERTLNKEYCVLNFGHLEGAQNIKLALKQHNENNPDKKPIHWKSFYKYCQQYAEDGIAGLADKRGQHRHGETKVNESDYDYFQNAYLTNNKKTSKQCWKETLGKARKEGRITLENGKPHEVDLKTGEILGSFPVASTFVRLVESRVNPVTICFLREGKQKYKQSIHYKHIPTTREKMAPGDVYVMDHHDLKVYAKPTDLAVVNDIFNKVLYHDLSEKEKQFEKSRLIRILKNGMSSKKTVRLWLTNCMDVRTNKQLSWLVHEDAPNQDHVMLVFKWAVENYGYPWKLMMDNGKDFRARSFAGGRKFDEAEIENIMKYIPTDPWFTIPYESQAKPIERQYRHSIENFAKQWESYAGKHAMDKPDSTMANIKKGEIALFEDVTREFEGFFQTLNREPRTGKALNGKSPDQVWKELHPGMRRASQNALDLMTLRSTEGRQIHGNGFKMPRLADHYYTAPWMEDLSGDKEKYYAKWDPTEFWKVFIFRQRDNHPMGWAHLKQQTSVWANTPEEQEKLKEAMQGKREHEKKLRAAGRQIRKIAAGEGLQHYAEYVELQNEIIEEVGDLRNDGATPMRLMNNTGLDQLADNMANSFEKKFNHDKQLKQNADFSDIAPESKPENTLIGPDDEEWYEDEPQQKEVLKTEFDD